MSRWGFGFGLPEGEHADELAARAADMARDRTLNPHSFVYGGVVGKMLADLPAARNRLATGTGLTVGPADVPSGSTVEITPYSPIVAADRIVVIRRPKRHVVNAAVETLGSTECCIPSMTLRALGGERATIAPARSGLEVVNPTIRVFRRQPETHAGQASSR